VNCMVLIFFTREVIKDIYFYWRLFRKSFRETVRLVKIMYVEGVHFSNAMDIRSDRLRCKAESKKNGLGKDSVSTVMSRYELNFGKIYTQSDLDVLTLAFPDDRENFVLSSPPVLDNIDVSDSLVMYRIIYEVWKKGYSFNPTSMDPNFYFLRNGLIAWASSAREAGFDFRAEIPRVRATRQNYSELMKKFSNRCRVCSYEGYLEYVVSQEKLVGGGRKSFGFALAPVPGKNFHDTLVQFKFEFDGITKDKIFSIPMNCIDSFVKKNESGLKISVTHVNVLEECLAHFEFYRIHSFSYQAFLAKNSNYGYMSVKTTKYNMDFIKFPHIEGAIVSDNIVKPGAGITSRGSGNDRSLPAWHAVGIKAEYGQTYVNKKFSGAQDHIYLNLGVITSKSFDADSPFSGFFDVDFEF